MFKRLWRDAFGGVISPEMAVVGALLVIGLTVGIAAVRLGIDGEIRDIGAAVEEIDFTPELDPALANPTPSTAADESQSPTTIGQVLDP